MLINPDFEGDYREVDGIGELKVARGWFPWWLHSDTRPEYKLATRDVDPRRVHFGQCAQQWFTTYATHTAGILQQVAGVVVGADLVFVASVQAWSSGDDDPFVSRGKYRMRIGIDPYGGIDPESKDIVWSDGGNAIEPYDAYQPLAVQAVARSDRCTVFVWGQPEWAVKNNNAYVDDCSLEMSDLPEPDPGGGLTMEQVRAIARATAREEIAAAVDKWVALLG